MKKFSYRISLRGARVEFAKGFLTESEARTKASIRIGYLIAHGLYNHVTEGDFEVEVA